MLNECYVYAHFVFNLFLSSSVVKVRLLRELYHTSLYSQKSHFVFTPLHGGREHASRPCSAFWGGKRAYMGEVGTPILKKCIFHINIME